MATNETVLWEEIWKRTPNAKHFHLADGSKQAIIFMGPVHYEDENGFLQDIDTKIHDEADMDQWDFPVTKHGVAEFRTARDRARAVKKAGSLNRDDHDFQTLRVPFYSKIPRNWRRGYTIGHGADRLTFKPLDCSPSKGYINEEANNEITYQDAWNDVDATLAVTDRGIKETLILKTDKAPTVFAFEILGPLTDDLTVGEMTIQPAWLEDAAGERRDVVQTLRREANGVFLDLIADVSALSFPVKIDPTVLYQPDETTGIDTYVDQKYPTNTYGTATYLYAGTSTGGFAYHSFIKFPISIPSNAIVSSGIMTLTSYGQGAVVGYNVYVHKVPAGQTIDEALTWNTQPTIDGTVQTSLNISGDVLVARDFNITNLCQDWVTNGNTGLALKGQEDQELSYKRFYSSAITTVANRPKLTVIYNEPPTAPIVTSPNGSETWNAQHTVTWTPSTDSETAQAVLAYQIQLTTDNGANYHDIVSMTSAGAVSSAYDFTNEPQSGLCKVRIRAYDGTNYGPWDYSNGVFTIQHNQAPTAPTNLTPNGTPKDRAAVTRLSWQHNDPNADPQAQFDLQWRLVGSGTWNTVTQAATNQFWDAPANTFSHGQIEWQVRTYDQAGLSSAYSAQATFLAGDKPALATITAPIGTVAVARPTLQWSSVGQTAYRVQTLDAVDAIVYDSGMLNSTNKAHTIGTDLANGENYTNKVIIQNSDALSSDPASATISVSYTPPATPTITATAQTGYIEVSVVNPVPSGTEPNVSGNDLYRRKFGESSWARIATGISANGSYRDYAVTSGVAYEYYVRAQGDNGTFSDSLSSSASIKLRSIWLHNVADPEGTVHQFLYDDGRSQKWKPEVAMMGYAGRTRPVAEFGELDDFNVSVKLEILKESGDMDALESLAYSKATVCFRDSRGRKVFGIIPGLNPVDERYGNTVAIDVVETDYSEVV